MYCIFFFFRLIHAYKFFKTFPPWCFGRNSVENCKHRGVLYTQQIYFHYTAENCSFISLFSFSRDFISHSLYIKSFYAVEFFRHLLFFQFYAVFCLFMPFFSHLFQKNNHLFLLNHFLIGDCSFHDMNIPSTTVFWISN